MVSKYLAQMVLGQYQHVAQTLLTAARSMSPEGHQRKLWNTTEQLEHNKNNEGQEWGSQLASCRKTNGVSTTFHRELADQGVCVSTQP